VGKWGGGQDLGQGQARAGIGGHSGQSRSGQAGSQVAIVWNRMGLGRQVTSGGRQEYLGAPPFPGLGTPVLPAHLLPEVRHCPSTKKQGKSINYLMNLAKPMLRHTGHIPLDPFQFLIISLGVHRKPHHLKFGTASISNCQRLLNGS
jgi:hypothetical protein